jgi:ABC-type antimicrobial peptide transport system permease subunit
MEKLTESVKESSALSYDYPSVIKEINFSRIVGHLKYLSNIGSRVTGYPGCEEAAEYIRGIFETYLDEVYVQEYMLPIPIDHGANLTITSGGNGTFNIYPVWPNLVCPSTLPLEGIKGELVYGGEGWLKNLNGKKVNGSIVLMDFNSYYNWLNVANLGAKAVIFIEPETTTWLQAEQKYLRDFPYNFPRFYIKKEDAEILLRSINKTVTVRINSRVIWEVKKPKNIIGVLKGTTLQHQYIVLCSYYDSWSTVPSVSPGATDACGVAVLLEIVRAFSQASQRPKYSIMFLALSGHYQGLAGITSFIESHFPMIMDRSIVLMVDIDLSTSTDTLTYPPSMGQGYEAAYGRWSTAPLKNYVDEIVKEVNKQTGNAHPYDEWLSNINPEDWEQLRWLAYEEEQMYTSKARGPLHRFGVILRTAQDSKILAGTPIDTFDRLKINNLKPQAELTYAIVRTFSNDEELKNHPDLPKEGDITPDEVVYINGTVAIYNITKAWYQPVPYALVYWRTPGRERSFIRVADENGRFSFFQAPFRYRTFGGGGEYGADSMPEPYVVDPETGNIIYAPDKGFRAYFKPPIEFGETGWGPLPDKDIGFVTIFKCGTIFIPEVIDPYSWNTPNINGRIDKRISVWSFTANVAPDSYGFIPGGAQCRQMEGYVETGTSTAVAFVPPDYPVSILVQCMYAERIPLMFIVNATEKKPSGSGYIVKAGEQIAIIPFPLKVAEDIYWINDQRIKAIKGKITSEIPLHEETRDLINKAKKALEDYQYDKFYIYAAEALSKGHRVYVLLRGDIESYINSIPFFALLLLPFAILFQSLIIETQGAKKILWIIIIFIAPLISLYFIHPGFILANNSLMVVMGISVLLLTLPILLIIFINSRGFMKKLREKALGLHFAEIDRFSAIISAYSLGIRNMRRRRMRTSLTLITLILIVFSIVSFVSISSIEFPRFAIFKGKPPYYGFEVRTRMYGYWPSPRGEYAVEPRSANKENIGVPIGLKVVELLQSIIGERGEVCPVAWLIPVGAYEEFNFRAVYNGRKIPVLGILGLTPKESIDVLTLFQVSGRTFFTDTDRQVAIICESAALNLGITNETLKSDHPPVIKLNNVEFKIIGIVDDAFSTYQNLDGRSLFPPDLTLPIAFDAKIMIGIHPERLMIIPFRTAMDLGAGVPFVNVRFEDPKLVKEYANEVYQNFPSWEVFAGIEDGIIFFTKGSVIKVMGLEFQMPLIVECTLIILCVMLGSIYERTKDIFIYSAVGLSPLHVTTLFIAEATVYAIISALMGYLLAITWGSVTIFISPVSVNYASTWVIYSLLIGMAIALLSAAYPAWKAGKLVTPSLERTWRMPTKPVDDEWEIPLPFVFSTEREVNGLINFLKEFFSAHVTADAQIFRASDIKFVEEKRGDMLTKGLVMETRLAPYEQGIIQYTRVSLYNKPPETLWKLSINLRKSSGPREAWIFSVRSFIDAIRKQLLLWQTLNQDKKDIYINM